MPPKGKGKPKAPPPPEPVVFNIENFATVQTEENALSIIPKVVVPEPSKTPEVLAAEQETTCGMMRLHIEKNYQGKPEFQIQYNKPGELDARGQEECIKRRRAERNIPEGIKEPPITYPLEEHGLPDIQTTAWKKEALTFPVFLNEGINFRKINNRKHTCKIDGPNDPIIAALPLIDKKKESDLPGTSKASSEIEKLPEVEPDIKITEKNTVVKDKSTEDLNTETARVSALKIWSSQRMLNEFMIYPVNFDNVKNSKLKKPQEEKKTQKDPMYDKETLEQLAQRPFIVTDNLTQRKIMVDPAQVTADDNGYYVMYDAASGETFVIDPPKIIALDPISGKELVIDPRKPVGQYFSVDAPNGDHVVMDTSEQQPYIYTDPVSGAQLLVDSKPVKPYTITDPRTGADIRIDPLETDGKPYTQMDSKGNVYSISPVVPGGIPVLFEHPNTKETTILGGPVMIKDPVTNEMKYQEGAFNMRDPSTGQNMKQIGAILKTNPETGQSIMMTNANYLKNPQTGEFSIEPSLVYKIQSNGKFTVVLPESEKESAVAYAKNKNSSMQWDNKLGVFVDQNSIAKVIEHQAILEERLDGEKSQDNLISNNNLTHVRSVDSLLDSIILKSDRKKIKKLVAVHKEDQAKIIKYLMGRKKTLERKFMRTLLLEKEESQNLFIKNLIQHFGSRLKYYDKEMFFNHITNRVCEENITLEKKVEKMIAYENNKALDAMLIEIDQEKRKLLEANNMVGTVFEYNIGCKSQICDDKQDPSKNNVQYNQIMEVAKALKVKALNAFHKALQRQNDLMRREIKLNLEKEKDFLSEKIDDLYLKIACQKYVLVK